MPLVAEVAGQWHHRAAEAEAEAGGQGDEPAAVGEEDHAEDHDEGLPTRPVNTGPTEWRRFHFLGRASVFTRRRHRWRFCNERSAFSCLADGSLPVDRGIRNASPTSHRCDRRRRFLAVPVACGADAPFERGARLPTPVGKVDVFTGVSTRIAFDSAFVRALGSAMVSTRPLGNARISSAGVATLPITGGKDVVYFRPGSVAPFIRGRVAHRESGIRLHSRVAQVELSDLEIDFARSLLTGTVSVDGSAPGRCGCSSSTGGRSTHSGSHVTGHAQSLRARR